MKQMINTLTNFLSNKINLTIMQCILYGILGYLLKGNYDWTQFCIVFVILLGIQFITHIKAVAQGMMMHQLMTEGQHKVLEVMKKMKEYDDNTDDRLN